MRQFHNESPLQETLHYMKSLLVLVFLILPVRSFGQDKNMSIHYGLLKTSYYQNNIEFGKTEFKRIWGEDEKAYNTFKQGRLLLTIGSFIGVPGILLLVVTIENHRKGNTPYAWQWIGGVSGSLIGTVLYYAGRGKTLESVKIFNSNSKLSFDLSGEKGIGLVISF